MSIPPKISFVITARNDDYGGNFLYRLRTSIRVLSFLAEKTDLSAELLVVEYNPPPDSPVLASVLAPLSSKNLPLRIITVPEDFHGHVRQESTTPFLEYIAKNIGIRRARAKFIATTNPDIVFSEAFIAHLAAGILDANTYYRANRHDMPAFGLGAATEPSEILDRCPRIANRVWTESGLRYVSYWRWWRRLKKSPKIRNLLMFPGLNPLRGLLSSPQPHAAAAGDFLMAHRSAWHTLKGFDQRPFLSYVDGYAVNNLSGLGYRQATISFPVYHINHGESNSKRQMQSLEDYHRDAATILRTGKPLRNGPENWGFPETVFPEKTLSA